MKLGFLTAPFADTPLMDVADWAASSRLREPGDRLLAQGRLCRPVDTRAPRTSTSPTSPTARRSEIVDELAGMGLAISRAGLLPQPAGPGPRTPRAGHRPPEARHRGARARWTCRSSTRSSAADASKNPGRELGGGAPGLAGHRALRAGSRRADHDRALPHALQRTTNGRPGTTWPGRRATGAGSSRPGAAPWA